MFTKTEETILNALPPEYKYIRRSQGGQIIIEKIEYALNSNYYMPMFNHIFKDVKPGCEPIRFRGPILNDTEREYLKAVFKPFASRIELVKKQRCNEMWEGMEYIKVIMTDPAGDSTSLPVFKVGTMYKGMDPNKAYTLEELGITYD